MGEEVARIPVNEISTDNDNLIVGETSIDLKQGEEIALWSDMDMSYEGDVALRFQLEIIMDTTSLGIMELDPMDKNITLGEVKTTLNDKTNWSFSGKNGSFKVEEDANYTFKAILIASDNSTLQIDKAELIIKK